MYFKLYLRIFYIGDNMSQYDTAHDMPHLNQLLDRCHHQHKKLYVFIITSHNDSTCYRIDY